MADLRQPFWWLEHDRHVACRADRNRAEPHPQCDEAGEEFRIHQGFAAGLGMEGGQLIGAFRIAIAQTVANQYIALIPESGAMFRGGRPFGGGGAFPRRRNALRALSVESVF